MSRDWYRKKSWTVSDRDDFFTRLKRARKDSRAQYLKIQAIELERTGEPDLLAVAECLLNQLFDEFPEDRFNRSSSLRTLGNIYKRRNDLKTALDYYKNAVDFEKIYPNVQTGADIDWSDLVVRLDKAECYDQVEELLTSRLRDSLFPITKYRGYSILAIIYKRRGDKVEFEKCRQLADENADLQKSGLRYHQDLGAVVERDHWLDTMVGSY